MLSSQVSEFSVGGTPFTGWRHKLSQNSKNNTVSNLTIGICTLSIRLKLLVQTCLKIKSIKIDRAWTYKCRNLQFWPIGQFLKRPTFVWIFLKPCFERWNKEKMSFLNAFFFSTEKFNFFNNFFQQNGRKVRFLRDKKPFANSCHPVLCYTREIVYYSSTFVVVR